MTLHEAIEELLKNEGKSMTTKEIASKLNINKWYQKKDNSSINDFQIYGRVKKYLNLFELNGTTVSLIGNIVLKKVLQLPKDKLLKKIKTSKSDKDETYVLNLCDEIIGITSIRQHKFEFLNGDKNLKGLSAKLPVDAYYPEMNLVIEYRERQHTENVNFFDKKDRLTVSGVHRGLQRKIYDERRREILPKYQVQLIEISYSDFKYNSKKRIIRDLKFDKEILIKKLKNIIKKLPPILN